MGFWSKLSDALPGKSMARGRELAESQIENIVQIPNHEVASDLEKHQCKICTMFPKTKDNVNIINPIGESMQIYLVTLNQRSSLSFHSSPDIEVCNVCYKVFLIDKF